MISFAELVSFHIPPFIVVYACFRLKIVKMSFIKNRAKLHVCCCRSDSKIVNGNYTLDSICKPRNVNSFANAQTKAPPVNLHSVTTKQKISHEYLDNAS